MSTGKRQRAQFASGLTVLLPRVDNDRAPKRACLSQCTAPSPRRNRICVLPPPQLLAPVPVPAAHTACGRARTCLTHPGHTGPHSCPTRILAIADDVRDQAAAAISAWSTGAGPGGHERYLPECKARSNEGCLSGSFGERRTAAEGRVRPTNPLNSLPETCRSSWAAVELTFVYTGSRPTAAGGPLKERSFRSRAMATTAVVAMSPRHMSACRSGTRR